MAIRVLPLGIIRLELRHVLHHFRARAPRGRHVQWCVSKIIFAARHTGLGWSRGVGVPARPHVATCCVRPRNHLRYGNLCHGNLSHGGAAYGVFYELRIVLLLYLSHYY
jgi:hypothetical protein